ncbi:LysR substrate-binding domain-containing protein [Lutibaculum baratangense]|uniref:Transcriptional regulator, LysR family n=1 Tax=Lutibaculum baratangense AMV1 TaxID=631454 RepID=V4T8D1_9HYPH|nr:LysR substrate-binding domain-containing protein [Lutibaculum baratangense]ESR22833.1 Transcriptional regulator, LysR family [Lutibaculum baratangense AMV1]
MTPTGRQLPLLEIDLLRTFVEIAETGSFSRAARSVARTPSAVSMQMKRLEEIVGKTLFVRDARSVRLTGDGEALIGYARRILRLSNEAVGMFRSPELEGLVRLGTPDDFGTRFLPNILSRFARTHPGVEVQVTLGMSKGLLKRLDAGALDLALVTTGGGRQMLERGRVVYTEPLVWGGLENGCAYEQRPLPLALATNGCAWRASALSALDAAGLPYRVAYSSEHCAGQMAAIRADLAIAPFAESLIEPPLVRLDERHGLPPIGDYQMVIAEGRNLGPAAEALVQQVVDGFDEMTGRRPDPAQVAAE